MKKLYELVVLFSPSLTDAELQQAQDDLVSLVTKHKGSVTETEVWGKKVLAYAIGKHTEAFYVFYTIELDTSKTQALDAAIRLNQQVIRYLLVQQDQKADKKAVEEAPVETE